MATGNRALAFLSLDDQTKAGFASFKRSLGEAGSLLGGFKAQLAGVLSVGAGTAFLATTVRQLDELADAAERTGRSAAELAQLQFAFKITGASADDVGKAMRALSLELSKAKQGSKEQAELFKALDIDVSGLNDASDALEALAEAFPKLSDLDRLRVARELLGKGGEALVPALKDGPEALRALREEGARLFPVTDAAAKAANEFGDSLDRLGATARGATLPTLTELLKVLNAFTSDANEAARATNNFAGSLRAALEINLRSGLLGQDPAQQIRDIRLELEKTGRLREQFPGGIIGTVLGVRESGLLENLEAAKAAQRRLALEGRTGPEFLDARDRALRVQRGFEGGRITLPTVSDDGALKKAFAEAERLRQLDATGWAKYVDVLQAESDDLVFTWSEDGQQRIEISRQQWSEQERIAAQALDRLGEIMRREGVRIQEELEKGMTGETGLALTRGQMAKELRDAEDQARRTADTMRDLGLTFSSAAEDAITNWKNLGDVIKGVEKDLLRLGTRKLVTEPLLGKFEEILKGGGGGGGGEGGFLDSIISGIGGLFKGFATGGSFMVGGGGGTDSQLVAFRATPGERVTVSTPQQGGAGGVTVMNTFNVSGSMDARSQQQIAAEVGRAVSRATRRNT